MHNNQYDEMNSYEVRTFILNYLNYQYVRSSSAPLSPHLI